jgi:hypothetical protein
MCAWRRRLREHPCRRKRERKKQVGNGFPHSAAFRS